MTKYKDTKSTSKQVGQTRDEKGRITGGRPPVGFHTNPENRSNGRWKAENSISYNYHKFMGMNPVEFDEYVPQTMAQKMAYDMVKNGSARRADVIKEITDRTEGKVPQSIDMTTDGEKINNPYSSLTLDELKKLAGK